MNEFKFWHLLVLVLIAVAVTFLSQLPAYLNANDLDDSEWLNTKQTFPLILGACTAAYGYMLKVCKNK